MRYFIFTLCLSFSLIALAQNNTTAMNIYDIDLQDIDGKPIDLKAYKGKKILFVNVASKCGFTPQYEELEKLSALYKDKLVVIGLPCNQFMSQEPGSNEQIKAFCSATGFLDSGETLPHHTPIWQAPLSHPDAHAQLPK